MTVKERTDTGKLTPSAAVGYRGIDRCDRCGAKLTSSVEPVTMWSVWGARTALRRLRARCLARLGRRCATCWYAAALDRDLVCAWCAGLLAETLDRLRARRRELEQHVNEEEKQ
jgi:hypothetical protein